MFFIFHIISIRINPLLVVFIVIYLEFLGNDRNDGGGEDGIRTHVPSYPDQLISSQRRCDRFGTSPVAGNNTPV